MRRRAIAKLVARIDRFAIDCDNIRITGNKRCCSSYVLQRGRLVSTRSLCSFDIISRHCYHTLDRCVDQTQNERDGNLKERVAAARNSCRLDPANPEGDETIGGRSRLWVMNRVVRPQTPKGTKLAS